MSRPVEEMKWFKQWVHTVASHIEQAGEWGAESIVLAGIKGEIGVNFATLEEFPTLVKHLQDGFAQKLIKGENIWKMIEERRLDIAKLPKLLAAEATGNSFVIIASCPDQHFDEASRVAGGNRNVMAAWGRVDDMSSLTAGVTAVAVGTEGITAAAEPIDTNWSGGPRIRQLPPGQRRF